METSPYSPIARAQVSSVMNSWTVYGCRKHLDWMAKRYNVHIGWVSGHIDILGNCRADKLVRRGMTIELSDEFLSIGVPLSTCKLMVDDEITDCSNSR